MMRESDRAAQAPPPVAGRAVEFSVYRSIRRLGPLDGEDARDPHGTGEDAQIPSGDPQITGTFEGKQVWG